MLPRTPPCARNRPSLPALPQPLAQIAMLASLLWLGSSAITQAQEAGRVELPLATYQELIASLRDPAESTLGFAFGEAQVQVQILEEESRVHAQLHIELPIRTIGEGLRLIPLVPPGAHLVSCTIDGQAVDLVSTAAGLAWARDGAGLSRAAIVIREMKASRPKSSSISTFA